MQISRTVSRSTVLRVDTAQNTQYLRFSHSYLLGCDTARRWVSGSWRFEEE